MIAILSFEGDTRELDDVRSKLDGVSRDLRSVGTSIGIFGGAIIAAAGLAVSRFIPFEDELAKIRGLVGVSNDELERMEPALRRIAEATGVGPQQLAEALFFVTSNSLRGAEAMEVLDRAARAQAVGMGDAETSARLATAAINAYGAENLSATQVYDDLTAAIRLGSLETDALAGSMGRAIPIASGMGVEFGELAGLMAAMSRTGTNADEAVTQLTQIMVSLLNPSAEAETALAGVGLQASELRRRMANEGLLETLVFLRDTFGENEDAMTAVFGNVRALRGVFDLLGPNLRATNDLMAQMGSTSGELDGAFERSETTGREVRRGWAEFQNVLIGLGEAIGPLLTFGLGPLTGLLGIMGEALESDNDAARLLVQGVVILGGALVALSAVLFVVAGAISAAGFVLGVIGGTALIVAGSIAALGAALAVGGFFAWKYRDDIMGALGEAWDWTMENWPKLLILLGIAPNEEVANRYADNIISDLKEVYDWVMTWWPDVWEALNRPINPLGLGQETEDTEGWIGGVRRFIDRGGLRGALGFKEGGEVPGPRGKPQPAVVHGGEVVLSNPIVDLLRRVIMEPTPAMGAPTSPASPVSVLPAPVDVTAEPGEVAMPNRLTEALRGFAAGPEMPTVDVTAAPGEVSLPNRLTGMLRSLAAGPGAFAPPVPAPAPAMVGTTVSVDVGGINLTMPITMAPGMDPQQLGREIVSTVSRELRDQIEDTVANMDGPIAR